MPVSCALISSVLTLISVTENKMHSQCSSPPGYCLSSTPHSSQCLNRLSMRSGFISLCVEQLVASTRSREAVKKEEKKSFLYLGQGFVVGLVCHCVHCGLCLLLSSSSLLLTLFHPSVCCAPSSLLSPQTLCRLRKKMFIAPLEMNTVLPR